MYDEEVACVYTRGQAIILDLQERKETVADCGHNTCTDNVNLRAK